ncbi:MAG TPA: Lrp/AsnC family transcriptional regulator [Bacteroidota bacterium]|nr:Lrp/AsnC family transcriptional regulator [Bacteroidota bacterium]
MLDDIDLKIVDLLQTNGRTRRNDIAELVGLSLPSTGDRLRKLEDAGYITGYYAKVDPKKFGKDITAFIFISMDTSKHYNSFLDHAKTIDDILECHAITGEGSHILKIRTENTASLEKLLARIQSWHGVTGTKTHLVLSTSKETTHIKTSSIKQHS